jgi:sec-independent protein translocase protein TatA
MPGFIGLPEIILLGLVALILFGPKRLPEMGRGLGKGMREFKESIGGDHGFNDHGLNETKLDVPTELTTAPTVPEPIATAAADRRNAA